MRLHSCTRLAVALACASCGSPTIPLPPPDIDDISLEKPSGGTSSIQIIRVVPKPGETGTSLPPLGRITIINRDIGDSVSGWVDGSGAFTSNPLAAGVGAHLVITYETEEGIPSEPLCVIVREQGIEPMDCPPAPAS